MELPLNKGLGRGFDYIDDSYSYTSKDPAISYWDKGINMLKNNEQNGKKTFLFLHSFYVHWPYLPFTRDLHFTNDTVPAIPVTADEYFQITREYIRFVKTYFRQYPLPRTSVTTDVYTLYSDFLSTDDYNQEKKLFEKLTDIDCGDFCLQPEYFYERNKNNPRAVSYIKALYDEEILRLDAQIQRVITSLTPLLTKNTILIITSDHGEAFMEHGKLGHTTLYNEILRVPLIMSVPHMPARKINTPVETIDIYPTTLSLLGLRPQHTIEGTDVSDSIRGLPSAHGNPYIISDLYDKVLLQNNVEIIRKQKSIITPQWKLYAKDINHLSDIQTLELYDVQTDPWDTKNVAKLHPTVVNLLVNQLKTYMRSHTVEFSISPDTDSVVPQVDTEEQRYFHY
jgi:arylsulfatase A-like enzyme